MSGIAVEDMEPLVAVPFLIRRNYNDANIYKHINNDKNIAD